MKSRFLHILGGVMGAVLFVTALFVLHRELKAYHLSQVIRVLKDIPARDLWEALCLTAIGYWVMSFYDILALRSIGRVLPYLRIVRASFIGYAFSNNIGFSMIAGATVRYRLYSLWGLSTLEITRVIIFCSLSLWLGFLNITGLAILLQPLGNAGLSAIHVPVSRFAGLMFLLPEVFYLTFCLTSTRPVKLWGWNLRMPPPMTAVFQITVSTLDWVLAGAVFYVLLPPSVPELTFPVFLSFFLTAQFAGLLSQVPGGLGVFESVILLLLTPYYPSPRIAGLLVAYRTIYYILPLLGAAGLLGFQELLIRWEKLKKVPVVLGRLTSGIAPDILSVTIFLGGVLLLFSGALPAVHSRLIWLERLVPLSVIEASHFLGSIAGAGLMILAWGLQRRIDAAYVLASFLLAGGILFSLFKGADYEEALVLGGMLAVLLPGRRHFYRRSSLFDERLNPAWAGVIALAVVCTVWLTMFSYKHVEYSGVLWWRFALKGDAPRSLRALVGVACVLLFFSLARLIKPAFKSKPPPVENENTLVTGIVAKAEKTYANLALLGDKLFLFSQSGDAFIMYGISGRSWIGMGDPVGPDVEWPDLIWRFRELSDRHGGYAVFYEVAPDGLHLYLDAGLSPIKLGEEARVPLESFTLSGASRKGLRYTLGRMEKDGFSFELVQVKDVPEIMSDLKRVSDAWLARKKTREKGFSLGFFNEDYLRLCPIGVIRSGADIYAFANLWTSSGKHEISVDLMRFVPNAPRGVMDYLFLNLMLWGQENGYAWFNLGMAPLSGIEAGALAPFRNRFQSFLYHHGEHFYNFKGLRMYKEKFGPVWTPKYLVTPGGFALPRVLTNLSALISGGMKGIIAK